MNLLCFYISVTFLAIPTECLYPKESPTREVKNIDGIWDFLICTQQDQDVGFREKWYTRPLSEIGETIPMPVPSSFNDITQNKTIRDYLGWAWYDTHFYVPQRWNKDYQIILRFGSAHYIAEVFVNGIFVFNHTSGHLPFEGDVTQYLDFTNVNRITVAINNTLSLETIPQGSKKFEESPYPLGYYSQTTEFDFFNYAGIHRSVVLYALPTMHIDDIIITTQVEGTTGYIKYNIISYATITPSCFVTAYDKRQVPIAKASDCQGELKIVNAKLWWPMTMHENPGYQYTLKVELNFKVNSNIIYDVYFQKCGIRTIGISQNQFLVNGKPFYFMGFGKHEDSNIRGKGLDLPLIIKDFNLINWIGANSFRTSHYPYAEELMDQADEQGIVVIDESPAVGLRTFTKPQLKLHMQLVKELIQRDKNRPSVFIWSIANEPRSSLPAADEYFRELVDFTKHLDPNRPVSAALNADSQTDKAGQYLDIVMMNHYYSWYSDTGFTETIFPLLVNHLTEAFAIYKKPIVMSEYGADTVAGLHMDPPFVFTEDYQTELMIEHHKAFDFMRKKGYFIGEHIWNFADFLTQQDVKRVAGNKKGIFTRERQPKASAKLLRCRYHQLMHRPMTGSAAYCYVPGDNFIFNDNNLPVIV